MKETCTIWFGGGVLRRLRTALLTLCGGLLLTPAVAQFPRNETFKGNSAPNFSFGGAARLTGTGGANDAVGAGYLRLTDATNNQAGYVIDNVGFPSSAGFTISFEFFSYGGTTPGADGFSVFLVDANQPAGGFRIGATGGSLGYAQKTVSPVADGVSKGYIGIGIDEFGNYSNAQEGRSGGSAVLDANGRVPNGVAIRGAGNGSAATDYPYLTGTALGGLGFALDVNSTRAQPGNADYRRAFIDVVPTTVGSVTTYRISVRIQYGTALRTAIDNFVVDTPPANLRLGLSGSTGGSTNIHEIRNLNIVQVPFANTDRVSTNYNQSVTVPVLANDVAPGSSIEPASVDLDPSTAGRQTTMSVPGKGTFTVDDLGIVTFVPSGTFAGTVAVPYTMQSILGADYTSSPANIRITVNGADVAATISGPGSAMPGTQVTYAMTTVNEGSVTALNVVPKLHLPASLPTGTVVPTSGGTYDDLTGWVTFAPVATLASGAPAVTNGVTFTVPAGAAPSLTGLAFAESSVPDPQASNNTASLTTNVGTPLPVELSAFSAQAVHSATHLLWTTASEKNNDRFEVQRSLDAVRFEVIGTVRGQGTTTSTSTYTFRDAQAGQLSGQPIYYRLRQVDTNGKATLSPTRAVQFAAGPARLSVSLYPNPNPRLSQITLELTALAAGPYEVEIRDVRGRVLRQQRLDGARPHQLEVQMLPPGLYLVRVQGAEGIVTLPFVQQ
ncbi:Por secretion system C-terminal sorting domain-containing protein [Hymenobacter daecheongensis DSM 21074]|uniref:Por secretion system C-terminal sorting domain-containing protein n=1 Tax=Hymenobacter daecheongensis DSM 21074 TaxID=1121955 RepID=A0A1M6ISL6_9BACT|nr:T9SS type A sorting domain-containing protein [Hymenobacter daecheongensis]SHJ37418.1 Por secretion system C-terminal sorting domain-containing protein [Hymenobacter daecheongensis DSM 21074]